MVLYTGGSSLQDLGSSNPVVPKTFIWLNLSCSDPVEVPYYSSGPVLLLMYTNLYGFVVADLFQDACIHCGTTHKLAERETNIYQTCSTYLRMKSRLWKGKRAQVSNLDQKA